jgi:hypothetical protein
MATNQLLSTVNSQVHAAASTLKLAKADIDRIDWSQVDDEQYQAAIHAARRAGVHAHALLEKLTAVADGPRSD